MAAADVSATGDDDRAWPPTSVTSSPRWDATLDMLVEYAGIANFEGEPEDRRYLLRQRHRAHP